jgi:hypothetical protein
MQLSPSLRSAAAAPYLTPAPFAVAAAGDHRLSGAAALAVTTSSLVTAAVRTGWERGQVAGRRRRVDRWLAWGVGQPPSDALISERMRQLVSPRERRRVARTLRSVHDQGLRPGVYRATVVNAPAAARNAAALQRLAVRLDALEQPVTVRGVARTVELLADGAGPLYNPRRAEELGPALDRALRELQMIDPTSS